MYFQQPGIFRRRKSTVTYLNKYISLYILLVSFMEKKNQKKNFPLHLQSSNSCYAYTNTSVGGFSTSSIAALC